MPRGGARAGAGRPRKPLVKHLLDGTYKPSRHGPLPPDLVRGATVLPMPPPAVTWEPDADALASLGATGRAHVERLVAAYTFGAVEAVLVLEVGHMLDLLAALRVSGTPLVREEVMASRQLASLLAQLRIES